MTSRDKSDTTGPEEGPYIQATRGRTDPLASRELATRWHHRSAEKRACYHQAYNLAALALDRQLAASDPDRKKAVVLDVDETVLDNSPFLAEVIALGERPTPEEFRERFFAWLGSASSPAQPGSVAFVEYARSRGVEVFYVTNRLPSHMEATLQNLSEVGFPGVSEDYILLNHGELDFFESKSERWGRVKEDYDVLLYIGDSLNDLEGLIHGRDASPGPEDIDARAQDFGTRYIILPNPMYGSWELDRDPAE